MASFIKWIGTIVILALGIVIAYKFAGSAEVSEIKVYKTILPSTEYQLNDTNKVYTSFELFFYTKDQAEQATKDTEIFEVLKRVLSKFNAKDFTSTDGLLKIRAELFVKINQTVFPVLAVKFYTNPKVY